MSELSDKRIVCLRLTLDFLRVPHCFEAKITFPIMDDPTLSERTPEGAILSYSDLMKTLFLGDG